MIAEVMDHAIMLKEPLIPRSLGLDGLVLMLRTCLEETKVRTYILIIDVEHFDRRREIREIIARAFNRYGISVQGIEPLNTYAYKISIVLGHRRACVYLAINGLRNDGIEENLAKLIELRMGETVDPNNVNRKLREMGKSDVELASEASLEELQQSFRGS